LWAKIKFALLEVLEARYRNGTTGEGRVGRWLADKWDERKDLTPEEIAKATGCSVANATEALLAEAALRESGASYDSVGDTGYDYSTEKLGPDIGFDDLVKDGDENDSVVVDAAGLGADNPLDSETGDADSTDDDLDDDHGQGEAFEDDEDYLEGEQRHSWDQFLMLVEPPVCGSPNVGRGYEALDNTEWENYCQDRATAKAQDDPGPYAKSVSAPLKPIGPQPEPIRSRGPNATSLPNPLATVFPWAAVRRPRAKVVGPYVRAFRLPTFGPESLRQSLGRPAEKTPLTAILRELPAIPDFPWPAVCGCGIARRMYEGGQWMSFRHVISYAVKAAKAESRPAHKAPLPGGSTRKSYEDAVATRRAQFALDWETYEQDLAAGKAIPADKLPADVLPRAPRPKAKPWPRRKRSPVTHVLLTDEVVRTAHARLEAKIEHGRQGRMLPGCAEPLPDRDVRPPHPSRIEKKSRQVDENAVAMAA